MAQDEGIEVDTLFVGCTRPTTYAGVPLTAFVVELIIVVEAFIFTQNLIYLLMIIPTHIIFYFICRAEPRAFELILLWLYTKAMAYMSNYFFWRVSSYSPLSLDLAQSKRKQKRNFW